MDSSNITARTTNNTTTSNFPQPPPPPPTSSSSISPSFFDPFPSYLSTFHQGPPSSSSTSSQPLQLQPPPAAAAAARSAKKRSRASRRAPTTVLTTDTSNFRAMVQEFTGFPAPPFAALSASPPFPHLSPSSSSPYFLSRPFAQKLPTPPSLVDAIAAGTATNPAAYPFACTAASSMIDIHNQNNILAPPPQFGDHPTSYIGNSEGIQQQQQHISTGVGRGGSSSNWADDQEDHQDPDQFQQLEKRRRKTSGNVGLVESWIHSSD